MEKGNGTSVLFFIYAVFGAYFIITSLDLIPLPDFFSTIDKWITLIGGILIVIGGLNHLRIKRFNRWKHRY